MDPGTSRTAPPRAWSAWRALGVGGSIAAALDLAFALAFAASQGTPPRSVLQMIASGLLGREAYEGGTATALLGVACHVALSFLWAGGYLLLARRWPVPEKRRVMAGLVFGTIVFLAMRLVVLPLSAFPHPMVFNPWAWGLDLASHMLLFGLPIALAAGARVRPTQAP